MIALPLVGTLCGAEVLLMIATITVLVGGIILMCVMWKDSNYQTGDIKNGKQRESGNL